MSRKRGDAVGSRCHRREGRGGVLMLFVSTCRASREFCVNSHFHLVLRYTTDTFRQNPISEPNARLAKIPMLDDPDVWRDVDAHSRHGRTRQSSRLTIVETVETHEDSRDERMCAESRGVRPPRTVAPVGRVRTPLTFGGSGVYINISHARPGMHNPMQIAQQRFGYTYRHSCSG